MWREQGQGGWKQRTGTATAKAVGSAGCASSAGEATRAGTGVATATGAALAGVATATGAALAATPWRMLLSSTRVPSMGAAAAASSLCKRSFLMATSRSAIFALTNAPTETVASALSAGGVASAAASWRGPSAPVSTAAEMVVSGAASEAAAADASGRTLGSVTSGEARRK